MYHFVVNPASKSNHGLQIWNELEKYLSQKEIEYTVCFSKQCGNITQLVKDICTTCDENPLKVVVLGGDGTLDEALQGITDYNKVTLGYIPTGSSNDFARALKYPGTPIACLERILACKKPVMVDLGKLEYLETDTERSKYNTSKLDTIRYFDVSCGYGFDAAICEEALNPTGIKGFFNKIGLGRLTYVGIAFAEVYRGIRPNGTLITEEGLKIELKKLRFVAAMNTLFEGGGFMFAPDATYDDGFLDICLVENISSPKLLLHIPAAYKGKHINDKEIRTYRTKGFEIRTDKPMWVHTDGEVLTKASSIKVSIVPGLLQLLL